jgi:hypothetical protein
LERGPFEQGQNRFIHEIMINAVDQLKVAGFGWPQIAVGCSHFPIKVEAFE